MHPTYRISTTFVDSSSSTASDTQRVRSMRSATTVLAYSKSLRQVLLRTPETYRVRKLAMERATADDMNKALSLGRVNLLIDVKLV